MITDRDEIIKWCREHGINGHVTADGKVDCQDVFLQSFFKTLTEIPIQFGRVGYMDIRGCKLKSLKGSPEFVHSKFNCSHTAISTLEFSPKNVGGFDCSWNDQLVSLRGCPKKISVCRMDGLRKLPLGEFRWLLLSTINTLDIGDSYFQNLTWGILMNGRIDGVMPSELIPGKISELKALDKQKKVHDMPSNELGK